MFAYDCYITLDCSSMLLDCCERERGDKSDCFALRPVVGLNLYLYYLWITNTGRFGPIPIGYLIDRAFGPRSLDFLLASWLTGYQP